MRISDWSSDVCSSDLSGRPAQTRLSPGSRAARAVSSGSGMVTLGDNRKAETTRAAASPFAARGSSAGEKLLGWVLPDVHDAGAPPFRRNFPPGRAPAQPLRGSRRNRPFHLAAAVVLGHAVACPGRFVA